MNSIDKKHIRYVATAFKKIKHLPVRTRITSVTGITAQVNKTNKQPLKLSNFDILGVNDYKFVFQRYNAGKNYALPVV